MPKKKSSKRRSRRHIYRRIRLPSDSDENSENENPNVTQAPLIIEDPQATTTPSMTPPLPPEVISVTMETEKQPVEPDLDPELLQALGEASDDTPIYGPPIHTKLAQRWTPILLKGLQPEVKKQLLKDYNIPDNCKLLKAPSLNPEIAAAMAEFVKNRDKKLQSKQDQLGLGITAINKAMSILLTTNDKVQALKSLSDGCRILTDLHFVETEVRTKLITPGLDKAVLSVIQEHDRDETLFGNTLGEKIKASKAIERQGLQIKKPTKPSTSSAPMAPPARPTRYQGNWSGPPRFQPPGRGGRFQYRSPLRRAPTAPPVSNRLPGTYKRAPTQQ